MVASPLLGDIADLRVFALRRRRVLRDEVNLACHWADTHPWLGDLSADPEDQPDVMGLAGVGAPRVELSSIAEFAAVLGVSTKAGQKLIGEALELRHRLPAIWARVQALEVGADQARVVASRTQGLSMQAAAVADARLVRWVGTVTFTQLCRTVERVKAEIDLVSIEGPEADDRHFTIRHDTVQVNGRSHVHAVLDLPDGLDLDAAICDGARLQQFWGSTAPLDTRRAHAAGDLARHQSLLPAPPTDTDPADTAPANTAPAVTDPADAEPADAEPAPSAASGRHETRTSQRVPAPRRIVLYLHLAAAAVTGATTSTSGGSTSGGSTSGGSGAGVTGASRCTGTDDADIADTGIADTGRAGAGLGRIANTDSVITVEQARAWLGQPGAKITIKPVIDLNQHVEEPQYRPSAALREQVILTSPQCVFPWCSTNALYSDIDHINPHAHGGPTSTTNHAPLCRTHHRMKTHHRWTYHKTGPDQFLWTSPTGERYLRHGPHTHTPTRRC